ncbi:hypothetical protein [Micromonospora rubida]|uniref:hypothetical protein n=1 Tax=Micromonospora rubida TaxID=2697657 RepID=UPI00137770A7|nr:hypothetical protein [Micromonospora rubida]NBE84688.1 hypothetical protein [Micromonospora rubida]
MSTGGEADDGQVIRQWATVVLGGDELTWLKEALQLNAVNDLDDREDDDLDPPG